MNAVEEMAEELESSLRLYRSNPTRSAASMRGKALISIGDRTPPSLASSPVMQSLSDCACFYCFDRQDKSESMCGMHETVGKREWGIALVVISERKNDLLIYSTAQSLSRPWQPSS